MIRNNLSKYDLLSMNEIDLIIKIMYDMLSRKYISQGMCIIWIIAKYSINESLNLNYYIN